MRSGEEIQTALRSFVAQWHSYVGTEKAEAQTFLNELFACYGSNRGAVGARFEDFSASAGFMDLHWPGECIVEMKAPNKTLGSAREQVKRYWEESADDAAGTPAARWVVLCNFRQFEVWEPGRFTMQTVWTLFAEDLDLLVGSPFQRTVQRLRQDPTRNPAAEIGFLFRVLNQKTNHNRKDLLVGTRYVNGDLFKDPAEVDLNRTELDLLAQAAEHDWSKVDPTIFGSLMEGVIGHDRRWELGAHYTHEADIMKIIGPTIVRPWQQRIDTVTTPGVARELLDELTSFVVLDPACGCGNFLYIAYRELRSLEHQLKQRITDLAASTGQPLPPKPWPYVPLTNLCGIDIEPVAVLIARITLWMGHRQMIDRYGEAENPLPLISLAGITIADAVFAPWPSSDCVVGNPPFLGDRLIRHAHGGDYVEKLKKTFGVGVVDYSAYWFRRAEAHLAAGQRGGLVSTNTLRENKHRLASLDYIVQNGGVITDAVSSQKWPGEAKVHVSITNWIQQPTTPVTTFTLDGLTVSGITPQLKAGVTNPEPKVLPQNKGRAFIGCQPTGPGFIVNDDTAATLIAAGEQDVVRRYLTTDDITDSVGAEPRRWIIDFGTRTLEDAMKNPKALAVVRKEVKPERDSNTQRHFARLWWQFAWPRPAMRTAVSGLSRYISSTLTGKRLLFVWSDAAWCPSNLTGVIALDDDYSMGVLSSRAHGAWAWSRSSTLKADLRYTPSTAFETFPWPTPTKDQRAAVAAASRSLLQRREEISRDNQIGLTELYNQVDDGAYTDLAKLHRTLDEAVAACYGWPKKISQDDPELILSLGVLNAAVVDEPTAYAPF